MPSSRVCSRIRCKRVLPSSSYPFKTCEQCREQGRRSMAKHKIERLGQEDSEPAELVVYEDRDALMAAVREEMKGEVSLFNGGYLVEGNSDSGLSDRELVQAVAMEIWKVSGYRFKVKDHETLHTGHKTRFWCSQDEERKAKVRKSESGTRTKHHDDMLRFPCKSSLVIVCKSASRKQRVTQQVGRLVTVRLKHACAHARYLDVESPQLEDSVDLQSLPEIPMSPPNGTLQ